MLISALMCGILSAIAKIFENSRLPLKVRAYVNFSSKCFALYGILSDKVLSKFFLCVLKEIVICNVT